MTPYQSVLSSGTTPIYLSLCPLLISRTKVGLSRLQYIGIITSYDTHAIPLLM